jgi:hypothetical protein
MGVRGLYHYCKGFLKPPDFKNYRIGIDVSSLLYRFHGDFEKIYEFLKPMLQNKILFVFDGKAPKYKERELQIRKAAKEIADNRIQLLKDSLTNLTNPETITLIKKRIHDLELENYSPSYEVKQDFKKFLYSKHLTYVKSSGEADALLVDLYYNNYIDAVLSNDMDYLVAGINTLYIPVKTTLKEVNLKEILEHEELNLEQFKEVAVLMGIDNNRIFVVDDFGIAASFIRHYGCISIMKEKMPHLFSDIIDIYVIKKRYHYTKNISTYLKPEHKDRLELWKMNLDTSR